MIFFKYVDIFNEKFHFYTENQPSYHSIFGGIMAISFILISIGISILFEYDELLKLNPISSRSEINFGYDNTKESLEKGKIWIPWRIAKFGDIFIDHRGILYPIIYSIKGKKNKKGEMNLEYTKLKYKLCNETSMANKKENYILNVNLSELFCIDDENSIIGGSWDQEEIDYIKINLYLCQDGIEYNSSDPRCQNYENLSKYNNNSWLFEYYYPVVQFQPTNEKIPMLVTYKSYYYKLSSYASKVERLYLKRNILSDDPNIIRSNPKNFTYWGMSNLYGDSYFLSDEYDPLAKTTSSQLYSLFLYKDQGLALYTRSYKKIYVILSEVFPILNIIFIIFQKVIGKIKSSYIKRNLMELLFEIKNLKNITKANKEINNNNKLQQKISKKNSSFDKNSLEKQQLNLNYLCKRKSNDLINSIKDEMIQDKSYQLLRLNKVHNNCSSCIDLYKIQNENKNKKLVIEQLIKYPISNQNCDIQLDKSKIINIEKVMSVNISVMENVDPRKKLFPIYYFFMDIFLDIIKQPKKFCVVSQQYLTVYNFMSQLYDISSYVLLYEQFNIIRRVLYLQNYDYFSQVKKINILNEEIMLNINENLRKKRNAIFSDDLLFHC